MRTLAFLDALIVAGSTGIEKEGIERGGRFYSVRPEAARPRWRCLAARTVAKRPKVDKRRTIPDALPDLPPGVVLHLKKNGEQL